MARKTPKTKAASNPTPKRAIDDNYVAPKRKPKAERHVTLQEALAESGESMEELRADASVPAEADRPTRPVGTSNLANTIRGRRKGYTTMLRGDKKTQNCGDEVAQLLLPLSLDLLKGIATLKFGKAYDHLNPGHARMCIGNLIRAEAKKDPGLLQVLRDHQPKTEAE